MSKPSVWNATSQTNRSKQQPWTAYSSHHCRSSLSNKQALATGIAWIFSHRFRKARESSSAQVHATLFLVHSETIPSTFVPTRPFRVNAGAPHTYVMMGDGTTKYIAELEAGDSILGVSTSGETRKIVLGRVKIEQRPMVKITGRKINILQQNDNTSHVFMQQAETVRLVSEHLHAVAVTELQPGQRILGWEGHDARHVGVPIQGGIEER